jgi:hypothetical protein
MKKVYKIFILKETDVCVRSTDYYSRRGDWDENTLSYLTHYTNKEYDSEQEAMDSMKDIKQEFTILPFYKKLNNQ